MRASTASPGITPPRRPWGASFLIGEATHGPIPPFTTDPATPNWLLVGTTFDTNAFGQTKNGDVYLAFWVVV
jgi:hypothetical protein